MPLLYDRGPKLTTEQFRLLCDLVNQFCGIAFPPESSFTVERRLRDRLATLGLRDFGEYYQYLRYHPNAGAEIENAVDALTTNETYFFREREQLRAFRHEVLPLIHQNAAQRRRLAIWSAGCSTGEEVYTIAILLTESGLFEGWDVRVFGTDISRRVLHVARKAVYGSSSFRAMPPEYDSYFETVPEGRQVHPRVRAICHFGHMNLLDKTRAAIVGRIDVAFCRNVLIYFDAKSRREVIASCYNRLYPGGYLLLGHSESLLNLSTAFELVHLTGDLVYRKPKHEPRFTVPPERGVNS